MYNTLAATLAPWLASLTLQQLGEAAACFASSPTPQRPLMSALCRQAVSLATALTDAPLPTNIAQPRPAPNPSSGAGPRDGSRTHPTPEAPRHVDANSPPLETATAQARQRVGGACKGVGAPAAASLVEVLGSCAQQRIHDAGLVAVCVRALAREVPGLSPGAVGRLAWALGMLGCVDSRVLEAIATTALMHSHRFTLQQVGGGGGGGGFSGA